MSLKPALLTGVCLLLSACTVVDLDASGNPVIPPDPNAKPSYSNQTAQQIAEQNWESKVKDASALSWADMLTKSTTLKAGTRESVFVRAAGPVIMFNHGNERERSLTVTINGQPVEVLIGPVIRSNAIRDAAGFRFETFTNQVQFAQLSKAMNRHATKQLPSIDRQWQQKNVQLLLAVTMSKDRVEEAVAVEIKQETP